MKKKKARQPDPMEKERIFRIEYEYKDLKNTSFGMAIFELLNEVKRLRRIR
jgi:hypothetical protein